MIVTKKIKNLVIFFEIKTRILARRYLARLEIVSGLPCLREKRSINILTAKRY